MTIQTIDELAPEDYTVDQLAGDLRYLCSSYPTNRNPIEDGVCVYKSSEGMCLFGLWARVRGHGYEDFWEGDTADVVLEGLGYDPDVCAYAKEAQRLADNRTEGKPAKPLAWGDVTL